MKSSIGKAAVWARKFACCQRCGKTDSPHGGLGFCRRCRDGFRAPRIKERRLARAIQEPKPKVKKQFPERGALCSWPAVGITLRVISDVRTLDGEPVVDTKTISGRLWREMPLRILEGR